MRLTKLHILIGLISTGTIMVAGSVTIPNTFIAGDTAKASEVNANFNAIKTEVNANAIDIATNKNDIATNKTDITANINTITTKQDRVAGTCATGSSIRTIEVNGTVVCEADTDTTYIAGSGITISGTQINVNSSKVQRRVKLYCGIGKYLYGIGEDGSVHCRSDQNSGGDITGVSTNHGLSGGGSTGNITLQLADGYVSIHSSAFNDMYSGEAGCYFSHIGGDFSSSNDSTVCQANASVQLPDHSKITSFACIVYRNGAVDTSSHITLYKHDVSGVQSGISDLRLNTNSISRQILLDDTISDAYIDNSTQSYEINFYAGDKVHTNEGKIRVYNCRIGYTFDY